MNNRMRLLVGFVKEAGLELLNHYQKPNKYCVDVEAQNGATRTFWVSIKEGDVRGDVNERAQIRRFARQNALETQTENDMARKQEGATSELTPIEFYRLCVWVKTIDWACIPSMEACTLDATVFMGSTVGEESIREALKATEMEEPEHWTAMPAPHVVVARELAAVMKALGQEPSRMFARMMTMVGSQE